MPAIQEYTEVDGHQVVKAPMGAKTDGRSLTFHNLCSLLKVTVTAGETLKVREIKVTAGTTNLSGSTTIPLSGEATYTLPAPATGSKSVTLRFGNSGKTLTAGDHVFYIYLPAFNTQEVCVEVYNIDANNVLGVKKKTFNGISVSANTINTVGTGSLTAASFTTTGALNGLFSVSADKKVRFSRGNLQYQASSSTWKFADQQYAYIGDAAGNTTDSANRATQSDWIDLFGWGAWRTGNNPWNITENGSIYQWGNGEPIDGWYTLSQDEWEYLLNTRVASTVNGTANARYAKAHLFGTTYGLIIFPDSYTHPADVTQPTDINYNDDDDDDDWDVNEFTDEEWAQMEAAGCVFLPAAGYRTGTVVKYVGGFGGYWSSTPYDENDAYSVYIDETDLYTDDFGTSARGLSVRLVQDY